MAQTHQPRQITLTGETTMRDELCRRIGRLCDDVLPELSTARRLPVRYDHCFRRIAYDNAVGAEWTDTVRRPFTRHATIDHLEAAYRIAARMVAGDRDTVEQLHNRSLQFRGAR